MDGLGNDIPIRFLIDNGISECFVNDAVVEDNTLQLCKSRGKLKVYLEDGFVRSSNLCLMESYVNFGEHAKFLDFHVMKLPKYDAILGKS